MNTLDPQPPTFQLSLWQKRQAAMIYHYASLDHLKALKPQIEELIAMADDLLQRRSILDPLMVSERWGVRDTAANWSTGGFPALIEFREDTMWSIAKRADNCYGITGANECSRMLREFSMQWATQEQEQEFRDRAEQVFVYCRGINGVMKRDWDDITFWLVWQEIKHLFPRLPKFKVHRDIEGESGKVPPRTGVYVPQDDPHGALQFGWTGGGMGRFEPMEVCRTFNDIGLDALKAVGRDGLWGDEAGLLKFIEQNQHRGEFYPPDEDLAAYRVGTESFTKRPCKWYFVELLEGEFEGDELEDNAPQVIAEVPPSYPDKQPNQAAGDICPRTGWWVSPAGKFERRYFNQGDIFPEFKYSDWGATFWIWRSDK